MNNPKKKINIGLLTSSRADYGIYKPLLKEIYKNKKIDLTIIAFGMHLQKKYGLTPKVCSLSNWVPLNTRKATDLERLQIVQLKKYA